MWGEIHPEDELLTTPADLAVARVAERQQGVVSTAQLLASGVARGAIDARVRRGWLYRVHRGVFAVGHRHLTARGRMWAAVLACGGAEAVALSHGTAAAAWDLSPLPARRLDVTTIGEGRPTRDLHVHRSRTLQPINHVVHQHDGLPVTTVARTLVDLAQVLTPHQLERACHRAEVLRTLDRVEIERCLVNGLRSGPLREALATLAHADPRITRSELEERFLALVAEAGLPPPLTNAQVAGYEVDFLWPDQRLVVETDGISAHLTPTAFEEDRRRDAALQIAGHRVARFTWRQVVHDARHVSMTLRTLAA